MADAFLGTDDDETMDVCESSAPAPPKAPAKFHPAKGEIRVMVTGSDGEREEMSIPKWMEDRCKILGSLFADLNPDDGVVIPMDITRENMETIISFYKVHHATFSSEEDEWDEDQARECDKEAKRLCKIKPERCRFGTLPTPKKEVLDFFSGMRSAYINQINACANKFELPALLLAGAMTLALRVKGKTQAQVLEEFDLPPKTEEELARDREAVIARHPWLVGKKVERE